MKGFYLTDKQLAELRLAHKDERNRRAAYKINAVILLGTGWKLREVREALLLDDETLRRYVQVYRTSGLNGLIQKNYQGRGCHLELAQQQKLCDELQSKIYLTTAQVISYVAEHFDVTYSPSGMRDLLHRLGYEFKKPKLVPGHTDRKAQEFFVDCYEHYMRHKADNVEVLFVDAVHPEHNTMAAYGWLKRGHKRVLHTNSGRARLNLRQACSSGKSLSVTAFNVPFDRDMP